MTASDDAETWTVAGGRVAVTRVPVATGRTRAPDGRTNAYVVAPTGDHGEDGPGATVEADAGDGDEAGEDDGADAGDGAGAGEGDGVGTGGGDDDRRHDDDGDRDDDWTGGVLVDPAARTDALDRVVADRGVEHVLVTHTHPDHVGGVADYADGRTAWALAGHAEEFAEATGRAPDRSFGDGDRVGPLEAVATPGHAADHVAFAVVGGRRSGGRRAVTDDGDGDGTDPDGGVAVGDGGTVLVGDLAVAEGSVVVGGPGADMAAYLDSLRRLQERRPDRLLPGHGPPVVDPAGTLSRLIEHRLDRERRVLSAVEGGARTVPAVTDRAYDRDLSGVEDLAAATVRAHLRKLAAEGAVSFDGDRTRPP